MRAITKIASSLATAALLSLLQTPAFSSDIPVYSGGVGEDDMNYIKSVEHQYDLKLMFTEANGTYLADLPVSINDEKGNTVVSTVTNGPILLVDLPAGTYRIKTEDGGTSREQKLSVTPGSKRIFQFRFPTHAGEISEKDEKN